MGAINANYPSPIMVNGYQCDNCAQVAEAKKGINPAKPQNGPYGADAPSGSASSGSSTSSSASVTFGGSLAGLNGQPSGTSPSSAPSASGQAAATSQPPSPWYAAGAQVSLSV